MSETIDLHDGRWIVIPKGFEGSETLKVTLQWLPPEIAQMEKVDWPKPSEQPAFTVFVRIAAGVNPGTQRQQAALPWPSAPDGDVWQAAFASPPCEAPAVAVLTEPKVHKDPGQADSVPEPASLGWQTHALVQMLEGASNAMSTVHDQCMQVAATLHDTRSVAARSLPMRPSISGRSIVSTVPGITPLGTAFGTLSLADESHGVLKATASAILNTYLPGELSALELERWVRRLDSDTVQMKAEPRVANLFNQLKTAYSESAPRGNKATGAKAEGWQAIAAVEATTGVSYESLYAIAKRLSRPPQDQQPLEVKVDPVNMQIVVEEAIVGMAPCDTKHLQAMDDPPPNRLAAIGHAFTLQMRLGMLTDHQLSLAPFPNALAARDAGQPFEIAVQPSFVQSPPTVWTRVGKDGWPADDDAKADGYIAMSSGLMDLSNARLTNVELRQSLLHVVGAVKTTTSRLDYALHAPDDKQPLDTEFLTRFKSGPLSLHMHGMARRGVMQQGASASGKETILTLQSLLIGVRPEICISKAWRALLSRRLKYRLNEVLLTDIPGSDAATREDGFIPFNRMSAALGETWVADDELFAWSGWNPAVPVPGADTATDKHCALRAEVSPIPESNPVFRYGLCVHARVRMVMRDGTCLPHTHDSTDVDMKHVLGTQLLRYEPLKAPAVLLNKAPVPARGLPPETLTRVVLNSGNDSSSTRQKSVRYWLPGEINDLFELDRHGAFDTGRVPRDSAFTAYARTAKGFPTIDVTDSTSVRKPADAAWDKRRTPSASRSGLPVFVHGANDRSLPYHPDPLVSALVVALARKSADGQWWPIVLDGRGICCIHTFYPSARRWPEAVALRVEFDGTTTSGMPGLRYRRLTGAIDEALLQVAVPAGEQFSLVAWPIGQPEDLKAKHAYGVLGAHWDALLARASDHQDGLPFPPQGISNLLSETSVIDVDHFVAVPPMAQLFAGDAKIAFVRATGTVHQPFAFRLRASPGSVGGLNVLARWVDPIDDPTIGPPVELPARPAADDVHYATAPNCPQAVVMDASSAWHRAIDSALPEIRVNTLKRPDIEVPGQGWINGEFALPDGKHRFVRYVPVAHNALPATEGVTPERIVLKRDGRGVVVNVLASVPPAAPVVRDILPAFRFARSQQPDFVRSDRQTALTLKLERGWYSSGPGELLAVFVQRNGSVDYPGMTVGPLRISSWGADATRAVDGKIRQPLLARHFLPASRRVATIPDNEHVEAVLYEPDFDVSSDAWRVDISLDVPPDATQPFVQLAIARYQPDAIPDALFSPVTMVDFIQWQDQRSVSVITEVGDPSRYNVVVWGPPMETQTLSDRELTLQLETAAPGYGPAIWQRAGEPVRMSGSIDAQRGLSVWRKQLSITHAQQRFRTRICLMERGRFVSGFDAAAEKVSGPVFFLEQLEFGQNAVGFIPVKPNARKLG
ncbi:hypothetical protein [Burkholderia sp. BE17]|uniref:hypothetical protein n=1 Tax=Burkholderia sp. BE17 TaxID=2656644 RepID=UPI00128B483C|nr:hypothetical protein [Burkholderia sp. BE17]MPV69137.1 hypothetical protein [Burkholderia sp. BE17]